MIRKTAEILQWIVERIMDTPGQFRVSPTDGQAWIFHSGAEHRLINDAEVGQPAGVAGLDITGIVPYDQLGTGGTGTGNRFLADDGTWKVGGGGGVTDHSALTSLAWTSSGHTGTADRIAGFNGTGAASLYQIGVDIQAYDADLTGLAGLSNGLPYRSSGTWSTATYQGMLSVVGGEWKVIGLREAGGTDLTIGAISGSKLLGVAAGSIGGVTVGTGLSLAAGTLEVDTATIATQAWVGAGYQPLDADLTAIAALTTTGIAARTAANTWVMRSIAQGTGVTVTNGDGVAGNPTISFAGGTGQDDDPTTSYSISITPSNATLFSRDSGITVRSSANGDTAQYRATVFNGSIADFYSTAGVAQTGWNYSGFISFKVKLITGSSIAATCRYKMGWTNGGFTAVDAETASRPNMMFRYLTGAGHTNWMCYTVNASGNEEADSMVAVAANTVYLLEIRLTSTSVSYLINGATVATHTSKVPPTTASLQIQCGTYATGRSLYIIGARVGMQWN